MTADHYTNKLYTFQRGSKIMRPGVSLCNPR